MKQDCIHIKGARVHNLKNVDLDIPRNKLVVITGLSGSGKSSLAFDTLYAEGQRRYVESLSSYARQFLGRLQKPEVDFIRGIPPAIAIEQKVSSRNPRSTVGTSTEIYDYLKLLFARVGHTYSPVSGQEVQRHQAQDVVDYMMGQEKGTRMLLLSPVVLPEGRDLETQLEIWRSQGWSRTWKNGDQLYLVVDRVQADGEPSTANRLADSVETAFFEGGGSCAVSVVGAEETAQVKEFSIRFEADGIQFMPPSPHLFDFNSPLGACPRCEGFGNIIGIDPDLVVPDKSKSIVDGAIACWHGEKMSEWNKRLIRTASHFGFPIHTPFYELTEEERQLIWTGNEYFDGLNTFFRELQAKQYQKIQYRVMLARYRGKTLCPDCLGSRLRAEAGYVQVGGKRIQDLVRMPVKDLATWFEQLRLNEQDTLTAKRLLTEIRNRLKFLQDVGLGYLTLNRLSNSLSGGESQRINLATSLGSSLVGSLYILDEPSIGLHPRDTENLIRVLKQLRDLGNTIIVVEHDEAIMRAADYLIDVGPEAGRQGGEIVFAGDPARLKVENLKSKEVEKSYTLRFLMGEERMEEKKFRRPWTAYVEVKGCCENNLKNIDVRFPLHVMTVVTGVSGSGKSSLVRRVLYPALKKYYGGNAERTGAYGALEGDLKQLADVEMVDQNPIGKSSRSNPVTYLKAYDEIRKLFADQQLSKQMGYTPAHFSFNTPGGRCDECEGEGTITVPMQFMADLVLTCDHCHGRRFKQDILDVKYRDKSIYDVLEMTVNQAVEFFAESPSAAEKRIVSRLKPLQEVGLGYIKLGQSSSTLSGGESQRVKLAAFLGNEKAEPTLFLFDEPTTGLHYHDIRTLMKALNALIQRGHTVVIIEHNPDVIRQADHVIDLGPEGGEDGGYVLFEGTPDMLKKCKKSYTAKYV